MLNLKNLEQKLDSALENETQESLTSWLLDKRSSFNHSLLANGRLEVKRSISFDYEMVNIRDAHFLGQLNSFDPVSVNDADYKLAA